MITSTITTPTTTITGHYMPTNAFLSAALYYAEALNWLVFPLKPQSKIPLTQHGFKDATRNADQIIQWWTQYPDANIAIVTGAESGLFALDVDPRNGGNEDFDQLSTELGINLQLMNTPQSLTGSGGFHLFFQYPTTQVIRSGKLSAGIDIKGDGGYVVAPHSIHPNGRAYAWEGESDPQAGIMLAPAPAKLLALLVGKAASQGATVPTYRNQWVDPKQIQELQSALATLAANAYHDWVRVGMSLHSLGNDDIGFRLWDEWSQTSDKYDAREQGKKWRSFEVRRDLNRETIFWMAQQVGWQPPFDPSRVLQGNLVKALSMPIDIEVNDEPVKKTKAEEPKILEAHDVEAVDEFDYRIEPIGILKPICDYINATAPVPQPVLALNAAVSLVAALLGRKVQSATGLRTNLYINSLAQSGTGKGHAPKIIGKILRETGHGAILGGSKIASGAALFNRAASQPNTFFSLDEFGKVLGGITGKLGAVPEYKRSIIDNLLELYNRADEVITGTEYADQSIARKDIEYPCISVYAITTPETFFEAIDARSMEDGLLNRFITCPLPVSDQDPVFNEDAFIPDDLPYEIVQYIEQIDKKITGYGGNVQQFTGKKPLRVMNSPDADLLFRKFREQVAQNRLELKGTGFDLLWKRAPENAIKIAMIVALGDLSLTIEDHHAHWAIRYVDFWMTRFVKIAQQRLSESQFHALEQDVYRLICKAGKQGVTLRELTQYSRQFRAASGGARMQVIGWLLTSKQIKDHDVTSRRKAYVPLAFDEV